MYGLWVVLLVIAGRAKVTSRNLPAALAGLITNVVLLVLLVPPLGIAGAGIALCGAYVVMLGVMHVLVRRAFRADFEWRRLAQIILIMGGLTAAGDLALPTSGVVGFITRGLVLAAIPPVLYATGFAHRQEIAQATVPASSRRARGFSMPRPDVTVGDVLFRGRRHRARGWPSRRWQGSRSGRGRTDPRRQLRRRRRRPAGVTIVRTGGESSPAHARNVGAEHARGEWILFIDSDCVAPPGLLDEYFAEPCRARGRSARG